MRIAHLQFKDFGESLPKFVNVRYDSLEIDDSDYMFWREAEGEEARCVLAVPRGNVLYAEDLGEADPEVKENPDAEATQAPADSEQDVKPFGYLPSGS